jgi:hypothetical protein
MSSKIPIYELYLEKSDPSRERPLKRFEAGVPARDAQNRQTAGFPSYFSISDGKRSEYFKKREEKLRSKLLFVSPKSKLEIAGSEQVEYHKISFFSFLLTRARWDRSFQLNLAICLCAVTIAWIDGSYKIGQSWALFHFSKGMQSTWDTISMVLKSALAVFALVKSVYEAK